MNVGRDLGSLIVVVVNEVRGALREGCHFDDGAAANKSRDGHSLILLAPASTEAPDPSSSISINWNKSPSITTLLQPCKQLRRRLVLTVFHRNLISRVR